MLAKWQNHEKYVAELLGLDQPSCSGNKWYDPGDGVTRGESSFPLYADCKCTEKKSFSLNSATLADLEQRAADLGKRMIMPVRFHPRRHVIPQDYVVIGLSDFVELLEGHRE